MESTTDDLRDFALNAAADDEDEDEEDDVRLAFLREPDGADEEPRRHRWFPDKAGGAPAWLDPVRLPGGEARLCGFCGEPLRFALQAYAPLPPAADGEDDDAYHRALFVFMCPAMACLRLDQRQQLSCRRRVRVFRCQLPRVNPFYDFNADAEDDEATPCAAGVQAAAAAPLCGWCRTWGAEVACAQCAATASSFCSEKHLERHVRSCHANAGNEAPSASTWPEYVMETHASDDDESSSSLTEAEQEQSDNDAADEDEAAAVGELMDAFEADEDNAQWAAFQAIVSPKQKQDQVLRYGGARPLWAVGTGALAASGAPLCPRCGGKRRFEMQLMPQLLYFFHVEAQDPDPLDWATVAVYTCARSCGSGGEGGGGYVEEFAWVQRLPWRMHDE